MKCLIKLGIPSLFFDKLNITPQNISIHNLCNTKIEGLCLLKKVRFIYWYILFLTGDFCIRILNNVQEMGGEGSFSGKTTQNYCLIFMKWVLWIELGPQINIYYQNFWVWAPSFKIFDLWKGGKRKQMWGQRKSIWGRTFLKTE